MEIIETEVLIIGSGIAGLMAAEYLSSHKNVIVITKSKIEHSNSFLAQGGISAVITKEDSWQAHLSDTLLAGQFHNDRRKTEKLVREGHNVINTLSEWGVSFDRDDNGRLLLGKEGGHHRNRIVHAGGDQTGRKVMEALIHRVINRVRIETGQYAIDLLVENGICYGAFCKDEDGSLKIYKARHTILAGGGYAGIYAASSNKYGSDGSAICMAYRAGVELSDLEFVQFHPTIMKNKNESALITEAVRGEGAILTNSNGALIMDGVHPLKDLAPRDIVSRRLFEEIHNNKEKVYLDIRGISHFKRKFPGVTSLSQKAGISIETGLIPVSPGAHFTMGGIITDQFGRTSLQCLYAIGECANTGVHGANRLASNSLLEGAVFAKETADFILGTDKKRTESSSMPSFEWFSSENCICEDELLEVKTIQSLMDKNAGICRQENGLKTAEDALQPRTLRPFLLNQPFSAVKRFNMQTMAWLTVTSCMKRKESRGSHYRTDFPDIKKEWEQKRIKRSVFHDESLIAKKAAARVFN
jgi:L-aspartate oxidase